MAYKTAVDIQVENFDYYFLKEMDEITQAGKEAIPKDIFFKIFDFKGMFRNGVLSKLSFLTKLYILWRSFGKRWFIVIEDERTGLGLEDFKEYQKSIKKRDYSVSRSGEMITEGHFFLGNKELGDSLQFLNNVSASPAYNYLIKGKNKLDSKSSEWSDQMNYVAKFLTHYESSRKKFVAATGVSIPEWYVLLSLFHGKEMVGATLYKETFKKAYQSSPGKIKAAFGTLQSKGYIQKVGLTKGSTLKITPLGRTVVIGILDKNALNC